MCERCRKTIVTGMCVRCGKTKDMTVADVKEILARPGGTPKCECGGLMAPVGKHEQEPVGPSFHEDHEKVRML